MCALKREWVWVHVGVCVRVKERQRERGCTSHHPPRGKHLLKKDCIFATLRFNPPAHYFPPSRGRKFSIWHFFQFSNFCLKTFIECQSRERWRGTKLKTIWTLSFFLFQDRKNFNPLGCSGCSGCRSWETLVRTLRGAIFLLCLTPCVKLSLTRGYLVASAFGNLQLIVIISPLEWASMIKN